MKVADLDIETKTVIVMAHIYIRFNTDKNFQRLVDALNRYDKAHAVERFENLMKFIESDDDE